MEGVTILNQYVHEWTPFVPWGVVACISVGVLSILGIISACNLDSLRTWPVVTVWISVIGMTFAVIIAFIAPKESEIRYQVIIDESVSLVEFNEHYEVLEQEGLIYTVRERTEETHDG